MNWKHTAQFVSILLCAFTLKLFYSGANVNQLRWILAPTTMIVEFVTGLTFEFESHAGYITSDRSFVIAASCAGVNFLITAFLMLSLREVWQNQSRNQPANVAWRIIPKALVIAYLATLIANTVRISTALRLREMPLEIAWLNPNQLHRFEGIFIYFGFLLLLFVVSERLSPSAWQRAPNSQASSVSKKSESFCRRFLFPLLIYYATTLGIPFANGGYRQGIDFREHSVFVIATPLLLILTLAALQFLRYQYALSHAKSGAAVVLRPRLAEKERPIGWGLLRGDEVSTTSR